MAAIQEFSEGLVKAVKAAEQSVVRVEARRWNPASGIVWPSSLGDNAVIVTANHAVEQDEDLRVGLPGGGESSRQPW